MHKSIPTLTVAFILSGLHSARADESSTANTTAPMPGTTLNGMKRLGAGLIIGEPTGASVKYWLNDTMAVDGAAGWSWHNHTDFYLHSDVLWHDFDLLPVAQGQLPVYFGLGGLVRFRDANNDNQVGIRVPVGISYIFANAPVDVFAELAPALDVAPNVRGEMMGGVGIRYWF